MSANLCNSKKMSFKQIELKSTIIHYSKIITKSMIYSYTRGKY